MKYEKRKKWKLSKYHCKIALGIHYNNAKKLFLMKVYIFKFNMGTEEI